MGKIIEHISGKMLEEVLFGEAFKAGLDAAYKETRKEDIETGFSVHKQVKSDQIRYDKTIMRGTKHTLEYHEDSEPLNHPLIERADILWKDDSSLHYSLIDFHTHTSDEALPSVGDIHDLSRHIEDIEFTSGISSSPLGIILSCKGRNGVFNMSLYGKPPVDYMEDDQVGFFDLDPKMRMSVIRSRGVSILGAQYNAQGKKIRLYEDDDNGNRKFLPPTALDRFAYNAVIKTDD